MSKLPQPIWHPSATPGYGGAPPAEEEIKIDLEAVSSRPGPGPYDQDGEAFYVPNYNWLLVPECLISTAVMLHSAVAYFICSNYPVDSPWYWEERHAETYLAVALLSLAAFFMRVINLKDGCYQSPINLVYDIVLVGIWASSLTIELSARDPESLGWGWELYVWLGMLAANFYAARVALDGVSVISLLPCRCFRALGYAEILENDEEEALRLLEKARRAGEFPFDKYPELALCTFK